MTEEYTLYITTADRKALKGSIKAWEKRAAGEYKASTIDNCPLCMLHLMRPSGNCVQCPVMAWTGKSFCGGTPVQDYHVPWSDRDNIQFAKKEVTFLKDLLKRSRNMK